MFCACADMRLLVYMSSGMSLCTLNRVCELAEGRNNGLQTAAVGSATTCSHTSPAGKDACLFIKLTARQQMEQLKHPLPRTSIMQKNTSLLLVNEYISGSIVGPYHQSSRVIGSKE